MIEAGTGTGKSFGALVPALVMARTLGKRLVVSSSTVAFQHQYAEMDSPMLQSLLPLDFSFAVEGAAPLRLHRPADGRGQGSGPAGPRLRACDRAGPRASNKRIAGLMNAIPGGAWSLYLPQPGQGACNGKCNGKRFGLMLPKEARLRNNPLFGQSRYLNYRAC